jgi:hypothetical protein
MLFDNIEYEVLPYAVVPVHSLLYLDTMYRLRLKSVLRQTTNRNYIYIASAFSACYSEHNHNVSYLGVHTRERKSIGRSQWPRGLRPARTLRSCVRISFKAWIFVCVYSVFVLSCVQVAALRRADHSSKESYRLCKEFTKLKKRPGPNKRL